MHNHAVGVEPTEEERYLMTRALRDWDLVGPARATDLVARVIGFADAEALVEGADRLASAIRDGRALPPSDWERALVATEIAFASDVLGTGSEWTVVNGGSEETWILTLRDLQGRLASVLGDSDDDGWWAASWWVARLGQASGGEMA